MSTWPPVRRTFISPYQLTFPQQPPFITHPSATVAFFTISKVEASPAHFKPSSPWPDVELEDLLAIFVGVRRKKRGISVLLLHQKAPRTRLLMPIPAECSNPCQNKNNRCVLGSHLLPVLNVTPSALHFPCAFTARSTWFNCQGYANANVY